MQKLRTEDTGGICGRYAATTTEVAMSYAMLAEISRLSDRIEKLEKAPAAGPDERIAKLLAFAADAQQYRTFEQFKVELANFAKKL